MSGDPSEVLSQLRERLAFLDDIGLDILRRREAPAAMASAHARAAGGAEPPPGASDAVRPRTTAGAPAASRPGAPAVPTGDTTQRIETPDRSTGAAPILAGPEDLFSDRRVLPAGADPAEALETLRASEIGDCRRCKLCEGRRTIVFGSGNPRARLMFIGEGPGADEDVQGLPFVGRAGQKLTEMIEKGMGIPRAEVYIANIVKCRPPGNRDPEPEEIAACEGFLFAQIDIIRPRVIVALGRFAAQTLLRTRDPISRLRGKFWKVRDTLLLPTFHPAYLLRQYTPQNRKTVWEDLLKVKQMLESPDA